jgi:hypothetical protein
VHWTLVPEFKKRWNVAKQRIKSLENRTSRQDFSILGVAWPMHSLLDAERVGAPLLEHVVTVERQQGINVDPGIPLASNARQVRSPRVGNAKRVVPRPYSPDAGQGVARLISAGWVVWPTAAAKQEQPPHSWLWVSCSPRLNGRIWCAR